MLKRLTRWSMSLALAVCMLVSGLLLVTNNPTKAMADPEPNYPFAICEEWDPVTTVTFNDVRTSLASNDGTYGYLQDNYAATGGNANIDWAGSAVTFYENYIGVGDPGNVAISSGTDTLVNHANHTIYVVVTLPADETEPSEYDTMTDVMFEVFIRQILTPHIEIYGQNANGLVLGYTGSEIEPVVSLYDETGMAPAMLGTDDVTIELDYWEYNSNPANHEKSILNVGGYGNPFCILDGDDAHKYYLAPEPYALTVNARELSVAGTKVYDGTVSHPIIPVYTTDELGHEALIDVAIPTEDLTITPLDAEPANYISASETAYHINVALSESVYEGGNGNYHLDSERTKNFEYTINKANPTISLELKDDACWYYGNKVVIANVAHENETVYSLTDAASFTTNRDNIFDFAATKLNDTLDANAFDATTKFTWTTIPTDTTNPGSFQIVYTYAGDTNYNSATIDCDITIGKVPVYVRDDVHSLKYTASAQRPTTSWYKLYLYTVGTGYDVNTLTEYTSTGCIYADNTQTNTSAGTYSIQITLDDSKLDDGLYELSDSGATYTIAKKTLYVYSADESMYYGDEIPTLAVNYGNNGFVGGETAADLLSAPHATVAYNQYDDIGTYDITFEGALSNNYEFDYSLNTYKLTVNKRPITITSQNGTSVYGEAINAFTAETHLTSDSTKAGVVNGDNVYSLVCYEDPDAAEKVGISTTTAAGPYIVSIVSAENDNYLLTMIPTGRYTITNATLTGVSAAQTGTLTYNGEAQTATVETAATAVNSQEITFTYSDAEAGTYTAAVPAFTAAGAHTVYYKVNAPSHNEATGTFEVTIGNAALTNASVAQNGTLTYNGLPQAALVTTTGTTTLGANNITYTYSTEETGTYTNNVPTFTNAGNNYTVYYKANAANHNEASGSFTVAIAKKTLTVTADNKTVTYGDAAPAYTSQITGFENNETEAVLEGELQYACGYAQYSVVGTYPILMNGLLADNYTFSYNNGLVTVNPKAITVTIVAKTSTYGDAQAALTATTDGIVNNDANVYSLACEVTATSAVGTYNIVGTEVDHNYSITFANETDAYTVTKKALIIRSDSKAISYGDAAPTYTVTYTGFVNGQTKDDLTGELVFTCDYVQFADAGSYEIYPSGFTSGNYQISFYSDELTVAQKAITVTIADKNSVYGNAVVDLTATAEGIVNGDSVYTLSCPVTVTSNVGTYNITGTRTNTNYDVTFRNSESTSANATYTVTKRQLTITADNKSSYYGDSVAALTATISGRDGSVANNDDIYTLTCTATATSDATTYTITVGKQNDGNYELTLVNGTYTISKRPVTVIINDKTSVYGDSLVTPTASVPQDSPKTILAGDGQVYTLSTTATQFSSVSATYPISGETTNNNYEITFYNTARTQNTAAYTLTPRPITIAIASKSSRYGEDRVALTAEDDSAIVNNDTNVYSLTCTVTATSDAGKYNINGTTISANYTITFTNTENSYTVTKAPLTVSVVNKTITYGDAIPTTYELSYDGFVNNDNSGVIKGAPAFTCAYQQYSSVATYPVSVGGLTADNYNITPANGTLTVSPKAITVTITAKSSAYGSAPVALTATDNGIVNNDNVNNGVYTLSCLVNTTTAPGTYDITGTKVSNNYSITFANETNAYTVNKANLTVTAVNKTVAYGDAVPTYTVSYSGFVNNDDAQSLGGILAFTCTYAQYSAVGEYTITPSGLTSSNYNIIPANGTLTVSPKAIIVTIGHKESTYGSAPVALTATDNGIVNNDNANNGVYTLSCTVTATTGAGTYDITGTKVNNNYNITFANGTGAYRVWPKNLIVTAENKEITYGDAVPTYTVGYGGFVNNDNAQSLGGTLVYSCSYAQYSAAGEYTITPSGLTSDNYNINFGNATLTVAPKSIVVTITPKSSVYGEAPVALTATDNGIVHNDNVYTLACVVTSSSNAGSYDITGTANNANYTVTFAGEEDAYTVTQREVTLTWVKTELEYNEHPQKPEVNAGNVLAGDTVTVTVEGAQTAAGTYTATATALNDPNYKLPQNVTHSFTITKATSYSSDVDEATAATTGIDVSGILDNMDTTSDSAELELKVGSSTVKFDKEALGMIAENDNVNFTMATKTGEEAAAVCPEAEMVFEISLEGATFENGTATVTADFDSEVPSGKVAKLYYIDANGKKTDMHATFADGKVTFKTNHFSTYAVIFENAGSPILIIIIILVVLLIAGGLVAFFLLRKKKAQNATEGAEEVATEEAAAAEEEDKDAVKFGDKKTMNEEYALLSKADRKLFDTIKAHALTLENVKTSEAQNYYTVSYNKEKVVRFKLKRGEIIAEFFSNDKEFKELAGAKAKETASTKIKVKTEEDANKVMEIIDYKFKALSENKDEQ